MSIVKAMLHTGITPDFIVVDGSEGGTGAAPIQLIDNMGTPLREGLLFVHNTLVGAGLRSKIKVGASGKIISAFDIASTMAIGAVRVNSARGLYVCSRVYSDSKLSYQPMSCWGCNTGQRPSKKPCHVPTKAERVFNFHKNTMHGLSELIASASLQHPSDIHAHHLAQRINNREIKDYCTATFLVKRW